MGPTSSKRMEATASDRDDSKPPVQVEKCMDVMIARARNAFTEPLYVSVHALQSLFSFENCFWKSRRMKVLLCMFLYEECGEIFIL